MHSKMKIAKCCLWTGSWSKKLYLPPERCREKCLFRTLLQVWKRGRKLLSTISCYCRKLGETRHTRETNVQMWVTCGCPLGVCENEAVQRRAAVLLLDIRPLVAPQHRSSGHQGLLSCSWGGILLFISLCVYKLNMVECRLKYKCV